ncbi:MAG: MobF family relaxase [Acidimicrobiales bacterium]
MPCVPLLAISVVDSDYRVAGVLSIAKVAPGGEAYYLQDMGQRDMSSETWGPDSGVGVWLGAGAIGLGLDGRVLPAHLTELLGGCDPLSGVELDPGHAGRVKVAAFDLMFAAPKSVSLLFALGSRDLASEVQSGHSSAVAGALGYMESHGMSARRTVDGRRCEVQVSGALAAGFMHATSRRLDPHVHTHVLVANLVEGADGRWSALDARGLYIQALTVGYLYQAHLRSELTERLGVEWTQVRNGMADVQGVDRRAIMAFSQRRADIEKQLAERGFSSPRATRIATVATRPAKDIQVSLTELRERWVERASAVGMDSMTIDSLLARSQTRHEPQRAALQSEHSLEVTAILAGKSQASGLFAHEPSGGGTRSRAERVSAVRDSGATAGFSRGDIVRAWCLSLPSGAPVGVIEECTSRYLVSGMVMRVSPVSQKQLPAAEAFRNTRSDGVASVRDQQRWVVPRAVVMVIGVTGESSWQLRAGQRLGVSGATDVSAAGARSWAASGLLRSGEWDPISRFAEREGFLPRDGPRRGGVSPDLSAVIARGAALARCRSLASLCGELDTLREHLGDSLAQSRKSPGRQPEQDQQLEPWLVQRHSGAVPRVVVQPERSTALAESREGDALRITGDAWSGLHRSDLLRYSELSVGIEVRSSMLAMSALANPPSHLLQRLGPVPGEPGSRDVWYAAARAVEGYRERWDIDDSTSALGTPRETVSGVSPEAGAGGSWVQVSQYLAVSRVLDGAEHFLARDVLAHKTPSLAPERRSQLEACRKGPKPIDLRLAARDLRATREQDLGREI